MESSEEQHTRKPRKNSVAEAVRFPWEGDNDDELATQPAGWRVDPPGPPPSSPPGTAPACSGVSRTMPVSVLKMQKKTQSQLSVVSAPVVDCFFDINEEDILNKSNSTGNPLNSSICKKNDEMEEIQE